MKAKNKSTLLDAHWSEILSELGACEASVDYAKASTGAIKAWKECSNPSWMLWLLTMLATTKRARTRVFTFARKHARLNASWVFAIYDPAEAGKGLACAMACTALSEDDEMCNAIRKHWDMPTLKRVKAAIKKGKKSK